MLRDATYTGHHAQFWGSLDARRRARGVGAARADELRQGPARPARARLARRVARALPQRAGRRARVSDALEVAGARSRAAAGDEAEAVVQTERSGLARFAGSEVHQPTLIENASSSCASSATAASVSPSTNRTDDDGLARARRARRARPPTARRRPGLPRAGRRRPSCRRSTASTRRPPRSAPTTRRGSPPRRSTAAGDSALYGFFTSGVTELAVASTTGLSVSQRMTDATRARRSPRSTGCPATPSRPRGAVGGIDPAARAQQAVEKAERTRGAGSSSPASYRAVLEPPAFAELLAVLRVRRLRRARPARGAQLLRAAGIGEQVFDEQRLARRRLARPARAAEGVRLRGNAEAAGRARRERRARAASSGTARPRSAPATDAQSTGHAPPSALRALGAVAVRRSRSPAARQTRRTSWRSSSATGSTSRASTTSSIVDPREGVITGMTRDGTFRVRDGKIAEPLVNLRFTVAVPELLADVPGLTREHGAPQPERLLRRALPAGACSRRRRDGALRRHGRRLRARRLGHAHARVVDRAELVLAPAAEPGARPGARRPPRRSGRRASLARRLAAPRDADRARPGARSVASAPPPTTAPRPRSRHAATSRSRP